MKKTVFKLMIAAIMTASLWGCTNEEEDVRNNPNSGSVVEEGVPTYATFNFIVNGSGQTRAATDMPAALNESEQVESIRLLIFRTGANTTCEVNEAYSVGDANWESGKSKTVQLTSGGKRIFVIANAEKKDSVRKLLDDVKADATTLAQFYQMTFDLDGNRTSGGAVDNLNKLAEAATPMSLLFSNGIDKHSLHTLAGGIGMDESRNGGAAENNISIDVQRVIAKAGVYYKDAKVLETTDNVGLLSKLRYGFKNVNSRLYLFQHFAGDAVDPQGSTPRSPFYDAPAQSNYAEMFYMGYKLDSLHLESDVSRLRNYYVTENTSAVPRTATTTYAAIEGVFLPKAGQVVDSCKYNPLTDAFQSVVLHPTPLTSGQTLYRLMDVGMSTGLSANIFFTDKERAYRAAYCIKHKKEDGFDINHIDELKWNGTSGYIIEYIDGKCYYRLNMGEGSGNAFVPGIKRNHHYRAEITSFAGIGAATIDELNDDPEKPIGQLTHVTATITVVKWVDVDSSHEL